jgi:hypothetical protein
VEHTKEHTDIGQYPDAEDRMWLRLWNLLDDPSDDDWAYVYRVDQFEKPLKPYLVKYWLPGTDLIWQLQTQLGGGLFRILIRSGRVMKFAGVVGVEALHRSQNSQRARFW